MKALGITALMFLSIQAFSQHPFSKMGPKAKNFKHSFSQNFEPSTVVVYANASDKYEVGANAKNRTIASKEGKRIIANSNTRIVRGKGANAKNRYIRVASTE
jgi:hypothetical protein